MKRKSLSKKLRWEIFQRDKFRCQYCGRPAPEVLLEVDHIEPVAKGGTNELFNLTTSCHDCNAGKGTARLSDTAALERTREQMEMLEEKRQQIEMLLKWKKSLSHLDRDVVDKAVEFWSDLAPGLIPNDTGRKNLAAWIKKYGLSLVLDSMKIAADHYLVPVGDRAVSPESWELAFGKIPGICYMSGISEEEKAAFFVRGILKRRFPDKACSGFHCAKMLQLIKDAIAAGIPTAELSQNAKTAKSWFQFDVGLTERIANAATVS